MEKYEFTQTVMVAGTLHAAGDVIGAGDIPAGSLESCIRVGHVRKVVVAPDAADTFAETMLRTAPCPDGRDGVIAELREYAAECEAEIAEKDAENAKLRAELAALKDTPPVDVSPLATITETPADPAPAVAALVGPPGDPVPAKPAKKPKN